VGAPRQDSDRPLGELDGVCRFHRCIGSGLRALLRETNACVLVGAWQYFEDENGTNAPPDRLLASPAIPIKAGWILADTGMPPYAQSPLQHRPSPLAQHMRSLCRLAAYRTQQSACCSKWLPAKPIPFSAGTPGDLMVHRDGQFRHAGDGVWFEEDQHGKVGIRTMLPAVFGPSSASTRLSVSAISVVARADPVTPL
jgi:hypothetical protein